MKLSTLALIGWGIHSDQFVDSAAFAQAVKSASNGTGGSTGYQTDSNTSQVNAAFDSAMQGLDAISQHAFRALNDALHHAGATPMSQLMDNTALVMLSTWGPMDNTVAFLDSMLEADGRYTSPRHFTRSVYSSVASHAAIYFGIHGACETLAHGEWPICAVLDRAADILTAGRFDQVIVCWADQRSAIATDLCRRGVIGLGRKEFVRFTGSEIGYGAVAMVLKRAEDNANTMLTVGASEHAVASAKPDLGFCNLNIHAYPTDGAIELLAAIITATSKPDHGGIYYTELSTRHRMRKVLITRND